MSGFDYDTAIILAMAATSCFLLSIVWRLYSAGKDRDRRWVRSRLNRRPTPGRGGGRGAPLLVSRRRPSFVWQTRSRRVLRLWTVCLRAKLLGWGSQR